MKKFSGSKHYDSDDVMAGFVILSIYALIIASLAAWVTHIVWAIGKITGTAPVTGGEITLGVIGAFIPPFGAVHGFILWLS